MTHGPLRVTILAILTSAIALASSTRAAAQTLEVRPDTGRVTVGDPVALRLILRQYEGDALPAFAIDFRRGAVILHGTMRSEPVPIEIAAPALLEGPRGRRFDSLFDEADLVKFARRRPTANDAAGFLSAARALLEDWRDAIGRDAAEATDALR